MEQHFLYELAKRYPQLKLPIEQDYQYSEIYRAAVNRGEDVGGTLDFSFSEEDTLETVSTPAGDIDVVTFADRGDFEHALQALAYRCEPEWIPMTTGAMLITGLINWEKIHRFRSKYILSGGKDWSGAFREFTSVPENYRDSIILMSTGPYSNVPASAAAHLLQNGGDADGSTAADADGCAPAADAETEKAWLEKSQIIRRTHELTHFIVRKQHPGQKDAMRDEIVADAIGIIAAFGRYDAALAERFLGIEGEEYWDEGRLERCLDGMTLENGMARAKLLIEEMEDLLMFMDTDNPWGVLAEIEGF